ncbi:unnamed protein product [Brachionus calyciflorus]|uniref:Integrase catalytic domain-containing protein n=1 Tax=Brachionus calyciflorus TaxID=104777 RepID=A0A814QLI3_9BILA|nr:unnamed protein product [Brachionus calyciflorus]
MNFTAPFRIKDTKFEWTRLCEDSFHKIIEQLTNPPLLAYPDFTKPSHLATDASGVGIAGVLFQYDEQNNEKVVAYASRNLKPSERNYPALKLECLAIVWAVEQFRPYLYGRKFRVVSDHNPLAYLDNMKIKSTRIKKWRLMLAEMEVNCVEDDKMNLAKLQREDQDLKKIFHKLGDKSEFGRYFLKGNVLCKKYKKYQDKILVPKKLVESVLSTCHDGLSGGHLEIHVNGFDHVVIFTDYLSKWAEALPTDRINAKTIAKILINLVINRHSARGKLLSDQGRQFLAALVKEICEYMKIKKLSTTPYHAECNGQTERFNKTICQILFTYCNDHLSDWDEFLDIALFAYRVSPHETTLKSPFKLLYGRNPRLPGELSKNVDVQVQNFDRIWKEATKRMKKVNKNRKAKYNAKFPGVKFNVNDKVRFDSRQGLTHKLRNDKWTGPFKVFKVMDNNNLELEIANGKTKIVHVNKIKHAEESRDEVKPKSILKSKN